MSTGATVWGVMAEFETPTQILEATRRARLAGYRQMDAYTPYAVEGLALELGLRTSKIPSVVLIGGLVGAAVGFGMQGYSMGLDYPINIGGRPLFSWQAFITVTFEVAILIAATVAFLSMLFLNGLPEPHHPLFNVPRFERASQDRFFLCIEASDPLFDLAATSRFLTELNPLGEIMIVPETEPTEHELDEEEPAPDPLRERELTAPRA